MPAFATLKSALLAAALASIPSIPTAAPSDMGGRFILAAERGYHLLGQPVYLRIESLVSRPPSLEEGRYLLAVGKDREPERIYQPPMRLRAAPSKDARSGVSTGPQVRFARLIASEGKLLFSEPGHYHLRLVQAAGGLALSDTLDVEFRAPQAPADKKAYAILSRNPAEYALAVYLEGGDQLHEGMAIVRELAGFESSYSALASFILSSDWSQDFTDYKGNGSRPMDLEKALAWAQWDRSLGAYIPLRNAYRLMAGSGILAARNPSAPGLKPVQAKLAAFSASLSSQEKTWFRSF